MEDAFKGYDRGGTAVDVKNSSSFDRSVAQSQRDYKLVRIRATSTELLQGKLFKVAGNHLYVADMIGQSAMYIGFNRNPFIRIVQGYTYTREFENFTVKSFDPFNFERPVEILMYASYGKLIEAPPIDHGFNSIKTYRDAIATNTPRGIFEDLFTTGIDFGTVTVGRYGGCIILKNTDLANTLYITGSGLGNSANDGFPIAPGESITLDLSGSLGSFYLPGSPTLWGTVFTDAGLTCKYSYIVSGLQIDTSLPSAPNESALER